MTGLKIILKSVTDKLSGGVISGSDIVRYYICSYILVYFFFFICEFLEECFYKLEDNLWSNTVGMTFALIENVFGPLQIICIHLNRQRDYSTIHVKIFVE